MKKSNHKQTYKDAYYDIKASDALRKRVDESMKERETPNYTKRILLTVAAVLALFVGTVNLFPSVAYAASGVPGLGSLVRVVTFHRYEYKEDGFEANIVTPEIQGLLDPALEKELNEQFKEYADLLIQGFEQDVEELKAATGEKGAHMGVESNYIVKTDTDDFLAIDVYTLNIVGSSSTIHSFYTIDKESKQLLTLEGLFTKGADYVTPLSVYLKGEMREMNQKEEGMFWVDSEPEMEEFKQIKKDQNFYINENNQLVICFDKYEVAAGAQGSPEFVIPLKVIAPIVSNPKLA